MEGWNGQKVKWTLFLLYQSTLGVTVAFLLSGTLLTFLLRHSLTPTWHFSPENGSSGYILLQTLVMVGKNPILVGTNGHKLNLNYANSDLKPALHKVLWDIKSKWPTFRTHCHDLSFPHFRFESEYSQSTKSS